MAVPRTEVLLTVAAVIAAALIIVATGWTPARIAYNVELERAEWAVLARQEKVLSRFGIGEDHERFDVSQEHQVIVFSSQGIPKVVADVQFVGSYSETSKTWLWAWGNESIDRALVQDSLRVKAFGTERHLDKLTDEKWPATEKDGWEMATFQAHVSGADMMYSAPFRQGKTYLTLKNVRWTKPGETYSFVPPANSVPPGK